MMGVSVADARALTWWEFTALRTQWNQRHDPDGKNAPVELPDEHEMMLRHARIEARGIARTVH